MQGSVAKSHPEDRRYLCRFHPCNGVLMHFHEFFKIGKKQDLIPLIFKAILLFQEKKRNKKVILLTLTREGNYNSKSFNQFFK
jgi:hypothetical protein